MELYEELAVDVEFLEDLRVPSETFALQEYNDVCQGVVLGSTLQFLSWKEEKMTPSIVRENSN